MYLLRLEQYAVAGEQEKMCRVLPNFDYKKKQQSKITRICNDLVPRPTRYAEKARVLVLRRDRGKGREPPRKAGPRGSNRRMAAAAKHGSRYKAEASERPRDRTSESKKLLLLLLLL